MDLGTIGLSIETRGEEVAVRGLENYLAALRRTMSELRSAEREQQQFANIRQAATSREVRENMAYWQTIQSLQVQKKRALDQEARAAERAAQQVIAAEQRKYREAERISDAITSLDRQRQAALASQARAAEQATQQVIAAEQRKYREAERISDAITSLDRQRQAAISTQQAEMKQLESSYNQLAGSLDPVVRAQQRFDNSVDLLNKSLRQGIITTQQYDATLDRLRAQMALAGHSVNQYGQVVEGTNRTMIRASRDGVQQLGYQVGDFAVQLQSGTPFLVAFAQQGSQLLQIFGAWGAIAGAGLAVASALGSAYLRTGDSAKEAKEDILELSDVINTLNNAQRSLAVDFEEGLQRVFDDSSTAVGRLVERLRELEFQSVVAPIRDALDQISIGIDRVDVAVETVMGFDRAVEGGMRLDRVQQRLYDDARRLVEENIATAVSYDRIRTALDAISEARTTDSLIVAFADALTLAETLNDTVGRELAESLVAAAKEAGVYDEIMAKVEESTDRVADREAERAERNLENALQLWDSLQNQLDLQLAINQYGEESIRVQELRNEQELQSLANRLRALGVEEDLVQTILELQVELQSAAADGARFADEASRALAEFDAIVGALDAIRSRISSLGVSNIGSQARLAALQAGASAEAASVEGAIATERARLAPALGAGDAPIRVAAQQELAQFIEAKREELRIETEIRAILDSRRPSRGGAGAGADRVSEGLREAQQLFESTRTEAEQYAAEVQRINELHQQFPEIVTEDVVNRALRQLREGLDETAQYARRLEDAFARTATSIVMGSESAKEAVANLLMMMAEMAIQAAFMGLFRGLFSPLGWLFTPGALPSAKGNVFSGGNMVPFQDGGVVNGTTYFPMGGGQTGMMGEAGPEAIMPLRRDSRGRLGVQADGEPQRIILEVRAEEGEMFVPRIRQISGNVAVQVTSASMRAQNSTLGATLSDFDQRGTS